MSIHLRLLAKMIIFLIIITGIVPSVRAESPELYIEIVPASIEIPSEKEVDVLLVLRNPTDNTLKNVYLSWFTEAGVDVVIAESSSDKILPYATATWMVRISQLKGERLTGAIHFHIDYSWQNESGVAVPGVVMTSLEVTAVEPEPVKQIIETQVKASLEELSTYNPGSVHLVITNNSDFEIEINDIIPNGPDFLEFIQPSFVGRLTLAPREVDVYSFSIETEERVQPGKYLLLFEVAFEWEQAGLSRKGNAVATQEVEVGVFGVSEILAVLGAPSFLVLPGFLMLITWRLLNRLLRKDVKLQLQVKTPEFWLVAITLSLVAAFVYPIITDFFGQPRNYLEGYGLRDVTYVWFAVILLTILFYIIVSIYERIVQLYKQRKKGRFVYSMDDEPLDVLRKLHRRKLGLWLKCAEAEIEGETQRVYVLEPLKGKEDRIWIGPPITVEWTEGKGTDLKREVQKQIDWDSSPARLAETLAKGEGMGIISSIRWEQRKSLIGPKQIKLEKLQLTPAPSLILHWE